MGLIGTTTTSLLASGSSWKDLIWNASVIVSQHTQGRQKRTYITLVKLITESLCLPAIDWTIPVLLLAIQRSSRYQRSLLLLLLIMLLDIRLQRKFKIREGDIIGHIGVTTIGDYLMERDV